MALYTDFQGHVQLAIAGSMHGQCVVHCAMLKHLQRLLIQSLALQNEMPQNAIRTLHFVQSYMYRMCKE